MPPTVTVAFDHRRASSALTSCATRPVPATDNLSVYWTSRTRLFLSAAASALGSYIAGGILTVATAAGGVPTDGGIATSPGAAYVYDAIAFILFRFLS